MSWRTVLWAWAMAGAAWIAIRAMVVYARRADKQMADWADLARVIGTLNFLTFWTVAALIGGSALLGKRLDDQYFLGKHGRLTEVSAGTYWYSMIHTLSQLVTFPLVFAASMAIATRDRNERSRRSDKGGAA